MLVGGNRILEPGVVADVDEVVRFRQRLTHVAAERRFVANRRSGAVFAGHERWLFGLTALKVAVGDFHVFFKDAQPAAQRHVFAKGQQVVFVVAAAAVAEGDDGVVKKLFFQVARRDAGNQRLPAFLEIGVELRQVARHLLFHEGKRGFRQDDDRFFAREGERDVVLQVALHQRRIEFGALFDVALNEGDAERRAAGRGVRNQAGGAGGSIQGDGNRQRFALPQHDGAGEQAGDERQRKADEEDATDRREAVQRRVQRAVTGGEPGKTGKEIGADEFAARPQERNEQAAPPAAGRAQAAHQPGGKQRVEREIKDEQHIGEYGKRQRRAAEVVETDINPVEAAAEMRERKEPSIAQRMLPRRVLPQRKQYGERHDGKRAQRPGRKTKSKKDTGERREQGIKHGWCGGGERGGHYKRRRACEKCGRFLA